MVVIGRSLLGLMSGHLEREVAQRDEAEDEDDCEDLGFDGSAECISLEEKREERNRQSRQG